MSTSIIPTTETLTLRDKYSGGHMWLGVRDGVVVDALGCEPERYIGLSVARAKHVARYGGGRR